MTKYAQQIAQEPTVQHARSLIPLLQSFSDRLSNDERSATMFEGDWDTLQDAIAFCRRIVRASEIAAPVAQPSCKDCGKPTPPDSIHTCSPQYKPTLCPLSDDDLGRIATECCKQVAPHKFVVAFGRAVLAAAQGGGKPAQRELSGKDLPEAFAHVLPNGESDDEKIYLYTAEQMREYGLACVKEAKGAAE